MDSSFYKEYYHLERGHWWFKARLNIIFGHLDSIIGKRTDLKILNVGPATGRTSELLEKYGEVISVEYDQDCYKFVKETLSINIIQGSVLELPFEDNHFDLVCCFDVVEHVEDHVLAMQELLRVCKPSGILSTTVPAYTFLWSHHDDINHHIRRYTLSEFTGLIKQNASIVFKTYFNFWLFPAIAGFRLAAKAINWKPQQKRDDAGTDNFVMAGPIFQKIFFAIFNSEQFFTNRKISFPFGLSILVTWRKNG